MDRPADLYGAIDLAQIQEHPDFRSLITKLSEKAKSSSDGKAIQLTLPELIRSIHHQSELIEDSTLSTVSCEGFWESWRERIPRGTIDQVVTAELS